MNKKYYVKKVCGIYKISCKTNNKVYIGQSIDIFARWQTHSNTASKNKSLIQKDIIDFGIDNFVFEVLEECEQEKLNEREIFYIAQYNCMVPDGYNKTAGGSGSKNIKVSDAARKKMSEMRKGLKKSKETKARISQAMKGKEMTDKRKEQLEAARKAALAAKAAKAEKAALAAKA